MKIFLFILINLTILATPSYKILEENHNKALKLWQDGKNEAAYLNFRQNEKYAPSRFYIGLYYLYGFNTVEISYDRAFEYISEAADSGYMNAVLQKAILYYFGMGTIKNKNLSKSTVGKISPYIKILKADSESYFLILNTFKYKRSRKRKIALRKMIKKFNKINNRLIDLNLIFFYRTYKYYWNYKRFSRKKDRIAYKKLLEREIKKGNSDAQALYYEVYNGRAKNSFKILLSAAKQGDVNSQYNLYLYYKKKKDKANKLKWLKIAAKNGDKSAKKLLKYE